MGNWEKNNKNYTQSEFEYLLNSSLYRQDVVTFHILCQAIAIQFNVTSRETRLFIESQGKIIEERLAKIPPGSRSEIIDDILRDIKTDGSIKWKALKDVIASKRLSLTDLLINNGNIILEEDEFLEEYSDEFTDRNPDRMYNILVGNNIKELILSRLIMQKQKNTLKESKKCHPELNSTPPLLKSERN